MSEILFRYERVNPTSWVYLSSLLSIALFFKFGRFWTLRNVDLVLVILLAPALLCIKLALDGGVDAVSVSTIEQLGYIWLFSVNALLLVRMLIDPAMVRRPLLEANLSAGGMTFLGVSLMLFLAANVINGVPTDADVYAAQRAEYLANLEATELEQSTLKTHGPGFTFLYFLPHISTQRLLGDRSATVEGAKVNAEASVTESAAEGIGEATAEGAAEQDVGSDTENQSPPAADAATRESGDRSPAVLPHASITTAEATTARVMALLSQLMIVVGIVLVAARHFDNTVTGVSAATFYLMLPYTAMWTGSVTHALPGALLVWAVLCYRRPLLAGLLIGLLCGTIYHPIFLLPLWITFYWRRGVWRFVIGVVAAFVVLIVSLVFTSVDLAMFLARLQQIFGFQFPPQEGLAGAWGYWSSYYRIPLFALFVGLSFSFILWPAQKNLGTLLSCSAALMIGTQFWHAHSGGMALAWYLPVMLLTIFRPNLEDRVAVDMVGISRWGKA